MKGRTLSRPASGGGEGGRGNDSSRKDDAEEEEEAFDSDDDEGRRRGRTESAPVTEPTPSVVSKGAKENEASALTTDALEKFNKLMSGKEKERECSCGSPPIPILEKAEDAELTRIESDFRHIPLGDHYDDDDAKGSHIEQAVRACVCMLKIRSNLLVDSVSVNSLFYWSIAFELFVLCLILFFHVSHFLAEFRSQIYFVCLC